MTGLLLFGCGSALAHPETLPFTSPTCVPMTTAQATAGADPHRWQQLYAACLTEVQQLRDTQATQAAPHLWPLLPSPALQPAY